MLEFDIAAHRLRVILTVVLGHLFRGGEGRTHGLAFLLGILALDDWFVLLVDDVEFVLFAVEVLPREGVLLAGVECECRVFLAFDGFGRTALPPALFGS